MPLPRRPALGLLGVTAPEGGVTVTALRPGSAAAAQLQPGDRLLALADQPLHDPRSLATILRSQRAGDRVTLRLLRDGHPRTVDLALDALPGETYPFAHVLYDSLDSTGARLRSITVCPQGPGPHPVVLLLPGLTCTSVDFVVMPGHPLRPLVTALAAAGVATLRVERPGLGDSEGGPCEALGWWDEVALHRAGLAALAGAGWVDHRAIGLFGHSIGGMLAPLVARAMPVRRIAIYGSCALPWSLCMQRAAQRQAVQHGRSLAHVLDRMSTGRVDRFSEELEAAELTEAWSALATDVLVAAGGQDVAVDPADARALAELLAQRPAGATQHLERPDLDHTMLRPDGAACDELTAAFARFFRGR
ncbi:MAG: alpha/beta fold hydrolase [Nannocystis sp.]|nr:alpha/beta fold hydrolase [Nannocystis sp.]MBA3546604.1 alpha/beta fold hydrolase [Nannocystis sp.]